jgi:hypothetical protein
LHFDNLERFLTLVPDRRQRYDEHKRSRDAAIKLDGFTHKMAPHGRPSGGRRPCLNGIYKPANMKEMQILLFSAH